MAPAPSRLRQNPARSPSMAALSNTCAMIFSTPTNTLTTPLASPARPTRSMITATPLWPCFHPEPLQCRQEKDFLLLLRGMAEGEESRNYFADQRSLGC